MTNNESWPFDIDKKTGKHKQVTGMKLPEYLSWASGIGNHPKDLFLPPIQRGFVWKPWQIAQLWDSLLRGMPIGSLMVSNLTEDQEGRNLQTNATDVVGSNAMGLLDGQQRTLSMLIGWLDMKSSQHCLWIDLGLDGQAGSPFELRITTKTQPFGFQRSSHSRLSRHERKMAREQYDELNNELYPDTKSKLDHELFDLVKVSEQRQPRPWKADKNTAFFVRISEVWQIFKESNSNEFEFLSKFPDHFKSTDVNKRLVSLHKTFTRMESLEVPLVLIPDHISAPPEIDSSNQDNIPDPLILLFERIGSNGARLSSEDLLFSMIKQQWPKAQTLVDEIHSNSKVGYLMSSTDYVMTAFRLGASEIGIKDNPRPNPNDFHRHLEKLLGKSGEDKPLRNYLKKRILAQVFDSLYDTLLYKDSSDDIGLPSLMMPHLSRGLIQVLLRWFMLNRDEKIIKDSRQDIIAFSLFWFLNVWNEDKASKEAFSIINKEGVGHFPATKLYEKLTESPTDEIGLALPLTSFTALNKILIPDDSAVFRSKDGIFYSHATVQQRELYKRFCWQRKPLLLWLQRAYVQGKFGNLAQFAGLTDEDTVPYDYDHLCPQNHWGADLRNISIIPSESTEVESKFRYGRHDIGNCIGNLHVLDSSLNRSFGDNPLESKLKSADWSQADSLLYHAPEQEVLWKIASPDVDEKEHKTWEKERLQSFQSAVYNRAFGLYSQYYDACKRIIPLVEVS